MVWHYNIADIDLGKPTHAGHVTYVDAEYYLPDSTDTPSKIIFKKNKYGKPKYSRLEVAFSQLARLFLARGLTSHQKLVVNDSSQVVGLVTEHLCYVIGEKEGLNQPFFTLNNPHINCDVTMRNIAQEKDIPYYFFDKLPQGFFAQLLKAEKQEALSIDYASLASLLASSYTLEEDDLHKGNFGFYLIEKEGKPRVVFFKIDHDLMFADSIMSFITSRPSHWVHDSNAFNITAEDLSDFPNLRNSTNGYWPTRINYFCNPWGSKEYHNSKETEAFAHLADVPEFKKAKWMAFYKHILIPIESIKEALEECLDETKAMDRSQISLIAQATVARQARLRSVLFSIKEFREFVCTLTKEEHDSLIREQVDVSPHVNAEQLTQSMASYEELCESEDGFEEGDTPLHTAIKLGDYRYDETMETFGHFKNVKNAAGKTPLDIAMAQHKASEHRPSDIRKDAGFIMKHLLANGAKKSKEFQLFNLTAKIESYKFQTPYLNWVREAKTYQQFKDILVDLGENHSYCLKTKKNLAIECISLFIKVNQNHPSLKGILIQLKKDMNGESTNAEYAGLKYISQLRSKLWIIRQIRGLYGQTSTLSEINSIIETELDRIESKEPGYFSFFSSSNELEIQDDDILGCYQNP